MPLINCPKCGQAYDLPGVIAVRMSSGIAICHCGEWLSGSKAAVLARTIGADQIREIDVQPYRWIILTKQVMHHCLHTAAIKDCSWFDC